MAGAVDRVAADADAGALAETTGGELPNRLVGQSAGTGNDANLARLVDVPGHDADLALAGGDDAGAIGPDKADLLVAQADLGAHHVHDGNAFGDTNDKLDARIGGFEDGVGRAGGGDENHGGVTAGLLARFVRGIEDGRILTPCFTTTAGGDTRDDIGAVLKTLRSVESASFSGDALHKQACVVIDEDGHRDEGWF